MAPSAHSGGYAEHLGAKEHDLKGRNVLLSDHFIYFGQAAPYVPVEEKLHHGRGHRVNHSSEALTELESWLNGPWSSLFNDAAEEPSTTRAASSRTRDCRAAR